MALVFLVTTLDQLLCHWVQNLSGHSTPNLSFLMGPVASALLWPMLAMICLLYTSDAADEDLV